MLWLDLVRRRVTALLARESFCPPVVDWLELDPVGLDFALAAGLRRTLAAGALAPVVRPGRFGFGLVVARFRLAAVDLDPVAAALARCFADLMSLDLVPDRNWIRMIDPVRSPRSRFVDPDPDPDFDLVVAAVVRALRCVF